MIREFKLNLDTNICTISNLGNSELTYGYYKLKNRYFAINEKNINKVIVKGNIFTYTTLDDSFTIDSFIEECKSYALNALNSAESNYNKTKNKYDLICENKNHFSVEVIN